MDHAGDDACQGAGEAGVRFRKAAGAGPAQVRPTLQANWMEIRGAFFEESQLPNLNGVSFLSFFSSYKSAIQERATP
jgi:hypothetical protein